MLRILSSWLLCARNVRYLCDVWRALWINRWWREAWTFLSARHGIGKRKKKNKLFVRLREKRIFRPRRILRMVRSKKYRASNNRIWGNFIFIDILSNFTYDRYSFVINKINNVRKERNSVSSSTNTRLRLPFVSILLNSLIPSVIGSFRGNFSHSRTNFRTPFSELQFRLC